MRLTETCACGATLETDSPYQSDLAHRATSWRVEHQHNGGRLAPILIHGPNPLVELQRGAEWEYRPEFLVSCQCGWSHREGEIPTSANYADTAGMAKERARIKWAEHMESLPEGKHGYDSDQ